MSNRAGLEIGLGGLQGSGDRIHDQFEQVERGQREQALEDEQEQAGEGPAGGGLPDQAQGAAEQEQTLEPGGEGEGGWGAGHGQEFADNGWVILPLLPSPAAAEPAQDNCIQQIDGKAELSQQLT